ncbi:MAG: elongation factor P [Saprospiraceae bacterium]|nr:elongation factor P [Saprospiraceae bacterium]
MASTSDIKKGVCFEHNNDIFKVVDFQHVKPGKGAAFVYVKMKSVTKGNVLENNFPSGHTINIVPLERRECQYLYTDDMGLNFMDTESYDQFHISEEMVDNADLMKEGMMISILFSSKDNSVLSAELPPNIVLEVTYTETGLKGDTATNSSKSATVETGAEIKVPLFINTGDKIKVNSETRDYMERVK